jgi:hypothetical protein
VRKECRYAGAAERVFDQRLICVRIPEQNRYFVKRNAKFGCKVNGSGDLHALARFVCGGSKVQRRVDIAFGWR